MSLMGLSKEEAARLLLQYGENVIPTEKPKSFWRQTLLIVSEPMLILLIAAGAINFFLAEIIDALMLMFTVIIVLSISIYQTRRAENALAALKELTAPTAKVIRDGEVFRISSHQIVVGDFLLLAEGDRVSADARILEASSLSADESTLTGESVPVEKHESEIVFSGSLITRGHAKVEVVATGANSQLGKIGKSLEEIPFERSQLQRDVDLIVRVIGFLGLITVISVITIYGSTRNDWLEGGLAGIAAAMALIPEEFPVILTLFLAIGAWRMSKVGVIARRSSAIESLGSISVLCVDKTGTITENRMTVTEVQTKNESFRLESGEPQPKFREIIEVGALACPINAVDPMDIAFKSLAEKFNYPELVSIREYPVEGSRLAYIHIWQIDEKFLVAAKGAPETILRMSQIDRESELQILEKVNDAAKLGNRILAVSTLQLNSLTELPEDINQLTMEFLGIALMRDPVRAGVKAAVSECRLAGIKTIMITGDHPNTACAIAAQIGLDEPETCITGDELEKLSNEDLKGRIENTSVFARVRPHHKLQIVRALQDNNEVVGMTGDGVNDAPALRAADIGIAMGARGTDVAREAAALVITDDNYSSIVHGISRGRTTYANLQKAMAYVIAIHIPIFGLALLPIFSLNWPLILLPGLVAFHEVIIDPASSIVFEEESPDPHVMKAMPRGTNRKLFSKREIFISAMQGIIVLLSIFVLFLFALNEGRSESEIRSLVFGTLMLSNVGLILTNRSRSLTIFETFKQRSNPAVPWIVFGAFAILVLLLNIPALRLIFDLGALGISDWLLMFATSLLSVSWFEMYKVLSNQKQLGL